jgi:hypothetical protein
VRFQIDECLSVDLVSIAGQAGLDARHVAHIGKAGWKDWNVVATPAMAISSSTPTTRPMSGVSMRHSRSMPALSF